MLSHYFHKNLKNKLLVAIQAEVLDVKLPYRDAHVSTLVRLVAIEVSLDVHLAVCDADRLALGKPDACVTRFPCLVLSLSKGFSCFCIVVGDDYSATYGEIVLLTET